MNPVSDNVLNKANEAAIYILYLNLAHITRPAENAALGFIVDGLENNLKNRSGYAWRSRDIYRLTVLSNAIKKNPFLANSKVRNRTVSRRGQTACTVTNENKNIFVAFRGTGKGEWIDNGEGLSGIPEENTYKLYNKNGIELSDKTIKLDYATDQQVQALNWFHRVVAREGWNRDADITVCGHSKGGNKAQFVTIHSDLVNCCYSFDGQGFSPEALEALKIRHGGNFELRRQRIHSFSTDNDYINVLGKRLMPEEQIYFFESRLGFHRLENMLNINGKLNPQCEQGELSKYVETVSEKLMSMEPGIRKYATLGVMNIFQRFLGKEKAVNSDKVSLEQTILGMGLAIDLLLSKPKQ